MKQPPDTFLRALALHVTETTPQTNDYQSADYSSWNWFSDAMKIITIVALGVFLLWILPV